MTLSACASFVDPFAGDGGALEASVVDAAGPTDVSADVPYDTPTDAGTYPQSIFVHACALARSCGIEFEPAGSFGPGCVPELQIMTSVSGQLDAVTEAQLNCLIGASDCASAQACIAAGRFGAPCSASSYCDGTTLVTCATSPGTNDYRVVAAFDCATTMPSSMCGMGPQGATCIDGRTCSSPGTSCDGNMLVMCLSTGSEFRVDCDWEYPGTTCEGGYCVTGSACTAGTDGGVACNGNVATACVIPTNRLFTLDCAAVFDGHCSETGATLTTFGCVPNANDCAVGEWRCDGTLLQACVNGSFRTVDCASLGLRTCTLDPTLGAICAP